LIPKTEGLGSLPAIDPKLTITLVDLVYKVQEANEKLWKIKKSDLELVS
jgi:hypothetical protein